MLSGAFTRPILLWLGLKPSSNGEIPEGSFVDPRVLDEWIGGGGIRIQGLEEFRPLFVFRMKGLIVRGLWLLSIGSVEKNDNGEEKVDEVITSLE